MNLLERFTDIHIELTDKCQASCPMCARNFNGGAERPFVGKHEVSLDNFKSWFPNKLLQGIKGIYACGNYGDPIIANECLEIMQYIRDSNPHIYIGIHTNGSARTHKWWENLAKAMKNKHMVTFGIDGYKDSHVLYRRGTDYDKIIDNAKAFIQAGGTAAVDCLVFKHNQDSLEDFERDMLNIGFNKVNFKTTTRFYDMDKFAVNDVKGNVEYYLEPTTASKYRRIPIIRLEEVAANLTVWQNHVAAADVKPKCINKNEIYVDARGNVLPCCWVGMDYIEQPIDELLTIHKLRNLMIEDSKKKFSKLNIFNLHEASIEQMQWNNLTDIIEGETKPWTCVKNCHG